MKPALLLPLLLAFTASAFEFTGKVVGVYDGDTITVLLGKERVSPAKSWLENHGRCARIAA